MILARSSFWHFPVMPRQPDDVRSQGQSRYPAATPRIPFLTHFGLGHSRTSLCTQLRSSTVGLPHQMIRRNHLIENTKLDRSPAAPTFSAPQMPPQPNGITVRGSSQPECATQAGEELT